MTTNSSAERRRERMRASPQFRDGTFANPSGLGPDLKSSMRFSILRELLLGGRKRVPHIAIPVDDPLEVWRKPVESGLRATRLGHSSLFLELDGSTVLVDPVFGPRVSPVSFAGPKRFHPAPVTVEQLPPIDVVLISHDHHDHLDPPTIRALATRGVPFVTSLGVGARLGRFGIAPGLITELDWWEELVLPSGALSFTATPAQHFSGRSLFDRNTTLWSSWVLSTDKRRVFYSGDTGLTEDLAEIGRRFGPFDLSFIEIGAWHPAWGTIHLGPENALRAFEMLGGGTFVPVHWGTFDLALHAWDEPIETLLTLAKPSGARILTPRFGQAFEPVRLEGPTPWWRVAESASVRAASWTPALSD